eukprot:Pgem_evm1s12499
MYERCKRSYLYIRNSENKSQNNHRQISSTLSTLTSASNTSSTTTADTTTTTTATTATTTTTTTTTAAKTTTTTATIATATSGNNNIKKCVSYATFEIIRTIASGYSNGVRHRWASIFNRAANNSDINDEDKNIIRTANINPKSRSVLRQAVLRHVEKIEKIAKMEEQVKMESERLEREKLEIEREKSAGKQNVSTSSCAYCKKQKKSCGLLINKKTGKKNVAKRGCIAFIDTNFDNNNNNNSNDIKYTNSVPTLKMIQIMKT